MCCSSMPFAVVVRTAEPTGERLVFGRAGEEASDFREPDGKGIAEASDELVRLARGEKPNKLYYREGRLR